MNLSNNQVVFLSFIVACSILISSLVFDHQYNADSTAFGYVTLYTGICIIIWAGIHIKNGITGLISPKLTKLVTTGPYKYIRHPVYLGTAIALIGLTLITKSVVGILTTLLFFIPIEILRAKREDLELSIKYENWQHYRQSTRLFLPKLCYQYKRGNFLILINAIIWGLVIIYVSTLLDHSNWTTVKPVLAMGSFLSIIIIGSRMGKA